MASSTDRGRRGLDSLLETLVTYRLVIYFGGLLAIGVPLLLEHAFGVVVSPIVRTLIVGGCLGLMILTYFGERRHPDDRRAELNETTGSTSQSDGERERSNPGAPNPGYSRRTRTTIAIGLVGVAIGIYAYVEVSAFIGVLFVVGGLLFSQSAYRREQREEGR